MQYWIFTLAGCCLMTVLSGCSGGSIGDSSQQVSLSPDISTSGSVGDGPVVDASITFVDGNGSEIGQTMSDAMAKYHFSLPQNTVFPVTVRASGGLDLVTGRPLDFELVSTIDTQDRLIVNVSPMTTLQYHAESCLSQAISPADLKESILLNVGMGMVQTDPQFDEVGPANAAAFVKANEAIGEVVRRVAAILPNLGEQEVIEMFGCDLADGSLNGTGVSDSQTAAVMIATMATVSLETLANKLKVDGADAQSNMDAAVAVIAPDATVMTADVVVNEQSVAHLQSSLAILQSVLDDVAISNLQVLLATTPLAELPEVLAANLLDDSFVAVENLPSRVNTASQDETNAISTAANAANVASIPTLSLVADRTTVDTGEAIVLSWDSEDAEQCLASGSWSGAIDLGGTHEVASVQTNSEYELTCVGLGGVVTDSIVVTLAAAPPVQSGDVSVQLYPTDPWVARSASTTLNWVATGATSCEASGDWSGSKGTSGNQTVGPLTENSSYSLTCSDGLDNAVGISTVAIRQAVFNWSVPNQNTDGTPLSDLAGYRLYWGTESSTYANSRLIDNPLQTSYLLDLQPNTYYFVLTSVNESNAESTFSPELSKSIQ